jgi:hypothetical protein
MSLILLIAGGLGALVLQLDNPAASMSDREPHATSTTWVLQEFSLTPPPSRFEASWNSDDLDQDPVSGPGWDTLDDAIAWSVARAPRVLLRLRFGPALSDQVSYYIGAPPAEGSIEWHEPVPEPRQRVRGYSGLVVVREAELQIAPRETYRLVAEDQTQEGISRDVIGSGLPFEVALDQARSRSRVVVVGVGVAGDYHYLDAGIDSYTPARLPRLPK